jgi:SAM-dependent methyltransferase
MPDCGHALDVACGLGANALLLARHGLQVDACDASSTALAKLAQFAKLEQLPIATLSCDLENNWLAPRQYDLIVCSHYLFRPLCSQLQLALRPEGLLYYQTFTKDKISLKGPSCNEYLLERGELLRLFSELQPVFYREDGQHGELFAGQRNTACFIGAKL